jgi:hypothetical protein
MRSVGRDGGKMTNFEPCPVCGGGVPCGEHAQEAHAALRVLAEKATPGPYVWDWKYGTMNAPGLRRNGSVRVMRCADTTCDEVTIGADDARFIAAANPQVVLALLNEIAAKVPCGDFSAQDLITLRSLQNEDNQELMRLADALEKASRNHLLALLFPKGTKGHEKAYAEVGRAADEYRTFRNTMHTK